MKTETAFWDSSAIVPLCCNQPTTQVVRQLARRHRRIVVWWATSVEALSALTRLLREGELNEVGFERAVDRLAALRRYWSEIQPTERVRSLAESVLKLYVLRASDALQLAAALVWCNEKPKRRPFICFDKQLAEAAKRAGFSVLGHAP